jgi:hypothetical protein
LTANPDRVGPASDVVDPRPAGPRPGRRGRVDARIKSGHRGVILKIGC